MGSVTSLFLADVVYGLRRERYDPYFLEFLKPADLLCRMQAGRSLSEYLVKVIDQTDPIFEGINQVLTLVQQQMMHEAGAPYRDLFIRIIAFYQTYMNRVCQTSGEERSLLLKGKALLHTNDLSSFYEACEKREDEKIYGMISPSGQPFIPLDSFSADELFNYSSWLIKSQQQKNGAMQVLILEKLGDFYQGRRKTDIYPNDFVMAAHYFNAALALAKKEKILSLYRAHLMRKLELLERDALDVFCKKKMSIVNIQARRKELEQIRLELIALVDQGIDIYTLLALSTEKRRNFLAKQIEEIIRIIGPPKTGFGFFEMGSPVRDEAPPFGDVEYLIALEKDTEENRNYFEGVAKFLEIVMTNLGEAEFPVGNPPFSPTPHGFSVDTGGNVPLGGAWKLIGTPERLAAYQSLDRFRENIVTSNALTYVTLITGSEGRQRSSLLSRYRSAVSKQLSAYVDGSSVSFEEKERVHHRRALMLIKGHLIQFELDLSLEKERRRAFKIKPEIYRVMQSLMDALAQFFNLDSLSTRKRIEEMVKKRILSTEGGNNLIKAMAAILMFRLKAQLFYKDGQEDSLYHPNLCEPDSLDNKGEKRLYLQDEYIQILEEIYRTLYPFYFSMRNFFEQNTLQPWNGKEEVARCKRINTLRDNSFDMEMTRLARLLHHSLRTTSAERIIHQAVALNPNNIKALKLLIEIKVALGKHEDAIRYIQKRMALLNREAVGVEVVIETASCMVLMGKSLQQIRAFKKSIGWYRKAYAALEGVSEKNVDWELTTIDALQGWGECSEALRDQDLAKKYYLAAEEIADNYARWRHERGELYLKKTADLWICLGSLSSAQGNRQKADDYFQKALVKYTEALKDVKRSAKQSYQKNISDEILPKGDLPFNNHFELERWLTKNPNFRQMIVRNDATMNLSKLSSLNEDTLKANLEIMLKSDENVEKKQYVREQIREMNLCICFAYFQIGKLQCASPEKEEIEKGIVELVEVLKVYMSDTFVDRPQEAIIQCLLALASGYFKIGQLDKTLSFVKLAFRKIREEKLFYFTLECLSVFTSLLERESKMNIVKELLAEVEEIQAALEELGEEQGIHLLLPTLLQLHKLYKKFYPQEQTPYLSRMLDLILKYGNDELDSDLLNEFTLQMAQQLPLMEFDTLWKVKGAMIPDSDFQLADFRFKRCRTKGDGLCAMHALLGNVQDGCFIWSGTRDEIADKLAAEIRKRASSPIWDSIHAFFLGLCYSTRSDEYDEELKKVFEFPLEGLRAKLGKLEGSRIPLNIRRFQILQPVFTTLRSKNDSASQDIAALCTDGTKNISLEQAIGTRFTDIQTWLLQKSEAYLEIRGALRELAEVEDKYRQEQEGIYREIDAFIADWSVQYLERFKKNNYFLTHHELEMVAHLYGKKVFILTQERVHSSPISLGDDVVVIWHQEKHFERCEKIPNQGENK